MDRDPVAGVEDDAPTPALTEVLERAKAVGFLGPGPVAEHIGHAARFRRALAAVLTEGDRGDPGGWWIADIGAGGGVPGLPLLVADEQLRVVLIDSAQKRCGFLAWAVAELGLADRGEVWCGRAEEIGRQDRARERFDAVVARGFGPPPMTLECATPLVRPGGHVIISEPPVARSWPVDGLAELALAQVEGPEGVAVFERRPGLSWEYPRPPKHQQRRPVFSME